jgi:RimJ/RimL family protein N-acetyltransferase
VIPSAAEVIRTARLELLPLEVAHAEEMAQVLSDPALHRFIGGSPDDTDALRVRYTRLVAGAPDPDVRWFNWVIKERSEGCLVGTVQATLTASPPPVVAEVAWVVGTPWQGRGFAAEGARALVAWLSPRVDRVVAHLHPEHHASAAVARRCGLVPTAETQDGEVRWVCETGDAAPRRPQSDATS